MFSHKKLWFQIAVFNYQKVQGIQHLTCAWGAFGKLGHGNRLAQSTPKVVVALQGAMSAGLVGAQPDLTHLTTSWIDIHFASISLNRQRITCGVSWVPLVTLVPYLWTIFKRWLMPLPPHVPWILHVWHPKEHPFSSHFGTKAWVLHPTLYKTRIEDLNQAEHV